MRAYILALTLLACLGCVAGQTYRSGEYPSSTPLFGVSYSPFYLNDTEFCLPTSQVQQDMVIIREVADHVRFYGLDACLDNMKVILDFCKANGMRVSLGLFLDGDDVTNRAELTALATLLASYADIVDVVIVGNETLFAQTVTLSALLGYIRDAKAVVAAANATIPVTTAEVWPVLESPIGPELVAELDFVCMNMQPFWEGWDIVCPTDITYECTSAGDYIHLKAEGLEGWFNKPVWVCEAGWPTQGERCCQGRRFARDGLRAGPSVENATIFINAVTLGGRAVGRPTYIHAIFDEDWKRRWAPCGTCEGLSTLLTDPTCSTCELDYHFGIYDYDRVLKPGMTLPAAPVTTLK